jgi:membrane-associated phospholipid phosphatase
MLMVSGVTLPWDTAALEWFGAHRTPAAIDAMLLASYLADGLPIALAGLGSCALLWAAGRGRAALALLLAGLSGEALYLAAKAMFQRTRPEVIERLSGAGWHAYPSGHTMLATIIWGLALVLLAERVSRGLRPVLLVLAVAIPVAVALSRVGLGVHYPSDVLAGLALGVAWAAFWWEWSRSSPTSRSASTS